MAKAARLAQESGSMQVFVRTIEGGTVTLDAREDDSVGNLVACFAHHRQHELVAACRTRPASRLVHGGFQLQDESGSTLKERGIAGGSTLIEVPSIYGGGCDGGTTAQQRKFMRQADNTKKVVVRDESEEYRAKMHNCAASGKPLELPIVACELGYIFNKEDILKMIATKTVPAHLKHIRKLRDLFALELTENPNYNDKKAAMQSINTGADDRFICPITQRPANGRNPFLVYRGCGHVVSEQAHKQVGGSTCVVCARAFTPAEVIPLHPATEILEARKKALEEARAEKKKEVAAEKAGAGGVGMEGGKKREREGGEREEIAEAKKARERMIAGISGAGARVGEIHGSLKNNITVSAAGGSKAHVDKTKKDSVYASMFAKDETTNKKYDAFWGQGAMAGVLGGR